MKDPRFVRLGEVWHRLDRKDLPKEPPPGAVAILSYPDDEGVRLNNGREGAREGPSRILHYLGKVVAPQTAPVYVVDSEPPLSSLQERHEKAEEELKSLLKQGYRAITLGGGHDYGYPDAAAYYEVVKGLVLNIDQHLDVRPVIDDVAHSGTPFRRFIEKYGGSVLVEWGIQRFCNSKEHLNFAKEAGAQIYFWDQELPTLSGSVGLSVCLDAFSGIRGVSAPAVLGLSTEQGLQCVRAYRSKASWLGLYECAPSLDPLTEDSARFAAILADSFIKGEGDEWTP